MGHIRLPVLIMGCLAAIVWGFTLVAPLVVHESTLVRQRIYGVADPLYAAFGECGNPCHITANTGGYVDVFQRAAHVVLQKQIPVIVDGICLSGCSLFADMARPNVCVTPLVALGFHKGFGRFRDGRWRHFDPTYSRDIHDWVRARGGFSATSMLMMPFAHAARIWRACRSPKSAHAPRPHGRGAFFLLLSRHE